MTVTNAEVFLSKVAVILEAPSSELNLNLDFRRDLPDWDSMRGFAIIVMLEEEYGISLEVAEFLECKSLGDLWGLVGERS